MNKRQQYSLTINQGLILNQKQPKTNVNTDRKPTHTIYSEP